MKHEDQREFYSCPLCGTGTGNDIDNAVYGSPKHDCPEEKALRDVAKNNHLEKTLADFDEKFVNNRREDGEECDIPPYPSLRDKRIVDFITTYHNLYKESLVKRLREMRKKYPTIPKNDQDIEDHGYNTAINDLINLITRE